MLDRIPPRETTLAELPVACTSAEIAYSEDADEEDAKRALAELCVDGRRRRASSLPSKPRAGAAHPPAVSHPDE